MTHDDHIDCDNELNEAKDKIKQLQAELADEKGTVKHLRKKAEFDMPDEMRERFHNGQCPDACDVIDGPCACGASHNAKEWISKLQDKLNRALTALRDLHDQQNGPPLIRHAKKWQAAYDKAGEILEESE